MTEERIREIFAEELAKVGWSNHADMVLNKTDTSHGGFAAIAAMKRIVEELKGTK